MSSRSQQEILVELLEQHPEGLTPGAAWQAATDQPQRGEPEFRRAARTLLDAGAIARDGTVWRLRNRPAPEKMPVTPAERPKRRRQPVEEAGRVFLTEGLFKGGSVFARGSHAWTVEHAERLAAAVAERCRGHPGNFATGLRALLPICSDETRVLLAELLALSTLAVGAEDLPPEVKRDRVVAVIDRVNRFVLLPAVVEEAFGQGPAPAGTWHPRDLWPAVQYLAEFAALWLSRETDVRLLTVRHPGAWSTVVLGTRGGDAALQREVLLHLGHPDAYVPIFTGTAKRAIADALTPETGWHDPAEPVDATLARLRDLIEAERGGVPVDFYDLEWRERWQPQPAAPAGSDDRQAWFVRDWYPGGGDYLAEWLHQGAVTVPANERVGNWADMTEGDLVAVATRDVVHLGEVAGPSEAAGEGVVRRPVRWLTENRPIELARLRGKLVTDLDRQERVIRMRAEVELLASLARAFSDRHPEQREQPGGVEEAGDPGDPGATQLQDDQRPRLPAAPVLGKGG